MTPGERFKNWIESLSEAWKDRLRGWMASWVQRGINSLIDEIEPGTSLGVEKILHGIRDDPNTPADIRDLISKVTAPGHPLPLLLVIPLAVILFIPTLFSVAQPLANLLRYKEENILRTLRLDPITIVNLYRRFGDKYPWLFNDLKDQGTSDDRIDALLDATLFYPGPADLIRWQAREVFEPEMVRKYGLDDEFGGIDLEPFHKAGMTDEQTLNYWRAHWEHASWMQIVEMLHRGLLEEQDVYDWFRLVEIPPYWRDNLIKTAYTWPTRVDVRRFYDLQTIDEARLREVYSGMGYRGQNLEDYILWTKIYVRLPDLIARWKNGWISLDDVKTALVGYGMKAEAAQELIETKVKVTEPTETTEVKKLTIAQIIRWVKLDEDARREPGIELIQDLEYTRAQAEFIMEGYLGEMGSPETFEDFKNLTQKYRQAAGLGARAMPEELKQLADQVVKLAKEVESLKGSIADEEAKLIGVEPLPVEATKQRDKLRRTLHRTEAELARVKTDYEAKLLEWRKGV